MTCTRTHGNIRVRTVFVDSGTRVPNTPQTREHARPIDKPTHPTRRTPPNSADTTHSASSTYLHDNPPPLCTWYVSVRRLLCNYICKTWRGRSRHTPARGALRAPTRRIPLVGIHPEQLRTCHLAPIEERARQLPRCKGPTSTDSRCWLDRRKQASRVEERGLLDGEGHDQIDRTISDRHEPVASAFLHLSLVGKALVRR